MSSPPQPGCVAAPTPPTDACPTDADVVVVGAGPAGSACAWALARAGRRVVLLDQHAFPRDKVCGDGLIPDAIAALRRIGALDEVMSRAQAVGHVRCIAPRGQHVDVPGQMAVLPRRELDDILVRHANAAGAVLVMPARFEAPLEHDGRVVGVQVKTAQGTHEIRAPWTVLATGAVPQALQAAGLCERRTPSGVAIRGYVHNPAMVNRITQLQVVWHPRLAGGYGWVFPGPGGVFNIGTGLVGSHAVETSGRARMAEVNLRQWFATFCELYAPARELVQGGRMVGELKGAPLRCSLRGARYSRPGLLATGEAVGSTYAFTGEGIGKALETGLLAAEALLAGRDDAATREHHESGLRALQPRFDLYEHATHVNHRPWLVDLVVWRARKSERILRRMAGVLDETQNPGRLLSLRGLTKLLLAR
jgi:menaquinone-9 beta-reductase